MYRRHLIALVLCPPLLAGCGWFGVGNKPKSAPEAAPTSASADEGNSSEEAAAPTQSTDEAMTPPEGIHDVRPVFGTDTSTELPAILDGAKAGMKAKELEAVFPGISKATSPGAVELDLAKVGDKWVSQYDAKKPYKETLKVSFLDDGGLWRVDYSFDPAVVSDEFWIYAQKAGLARWGDPRGGLGDAKETLASYKVKKLRTVTLHKSGDEVRLEVDLRPCASGGPC